MLLDELNARSKEQVIHDMKNCRAYKDITKRENGYYFVNRDTHKCHFVAGTKSDIIEAHGGDEEIAKILRNPSMAYIVIDPTIQVRVFNVLTDSYLRINLYNSPRGHFKEYAVHQMPEIYSRFFQHLVPSEWHRKFLIEWIANSLKGRNRTYMVFVGKGGIGKGICSETVKRLHLGENSTYLNDDSFRKEFNSELVGKTFALFDEVKIETQTALNKLKQYVNDEIRIEGKGRDGKTTRVYFNLMLHSNYDNLMKISEDERRLSILDLTETKLNRVFSESEISALLEHENIERLFNYLWSYEITMDLGNAIKGAKAGEIVNSSASEWERIVMSILIRNSGKRMDLNSVTESLREQYDASPRPSGNTIFQVFKDRYTESVSATTIKGYKYLEYIK